MEEEMLLTQPQPAAEEVSAVGETAAGTELGTEPEETMQPSTGAQEPAALSNPNDGGQPMRRLIEDVGRIAAIDPAVRTLDDVLRMENAPAVVRRVEKGMSLDEAYILENLPRITARAAEAARQTAVNQARGLGHLEPLRGGVRPEEGLDIPEGSLANWQDAFPGLSYAQLREKYNRAVR